jgi:hypothetical protein
MNDRRVIYHPAYLERFRAALAEARAELSVQDFEYRCREADRNAEIAALKAELVEMRETLLLLTTLRREEEQMTVGDLHRQLEMLLVRLTQRDPRAPLH